MVRSGAPRRLALAACVAVAAFLAAPLPRLPGGALARASLAPPSFPPPALSRRAAEFRVELTTKVLPYWYDTGRDTVNGGYLLADDLKAGRRTPKEKQLVTQSRMIWGFSHAHRHGCSDARRDYLEAARLGYRFLQARFRDPLEGGYFWKTDLAGQVIDDRKTLHGQVFVVYALVEYYRAGGDREALALALDLFRVVQERARDPKHGGWFEQFTRDWRLSRRSPLGPPADLKSSDAFLHVQEAFAELYEASRDPAVREALIEVLDINRTWFFTAVPGRSCTNRTADWQPLADPRSAGMIYGHNVEFGWLMIRAETLLGRPPSWDHFEALLDHALEHGWDRERGGLFNTGFGDEPAADTEKTWWAQAEMMVALTDALQHRPDPGYAAALEKLVGFVRAHMIDPRDGIWVGSVTAGGRPKETIKAGSWKANYHDLRAILRFVEAFAPAGQADPVAR